MTAKFIRTFIVLSSVVLNLSCEKQQEYNDLTTVVKGLTIKASADNSSRTTFNGAETTWSANDEIKVLISDGNFATPKSGIFALSNATQKTFTNNDIEISTGVEYKFHAIYPATDIDSETQSASVEIGAASQTQNDTAPAAHIAALDPLYGCATATPEAVSINMKHTAVALKLDLQNDTGNNITIKKLLVTAPTGVAIAGTHTVNTETGTITPSNENGATSRTIELTLNPAVTIANEGKHTVWIATAPFTIEQGGSLLFTAIDTSDNEYDVIRSFVNGHKFSPGTISSTTLVIDNDKKVPAPQDGIITKEVTLDFSVAANLSPTTSVTEQVQDLLYHSGIYISRIQATEKCYFANGGLVLNIMRDDNYTKVTLPQLSGYKINAITFNNVKNDDEYGAIKVTVELYNNKDVICQIKNKGEGRDFYSYITKKTCTLDEMIGITNDSQYYMKLYDSPKLHHIKSWVITYQRIQ